VLLRTEGKHLDRCCRGGGSRTVLGAAID
jgi:hypothetical protein